MGAEPKLYVVPLQAHESAGLHVADICWGSCGKGLIGGVHIGNDSAIPCDQPADQCPAFDKEMSEPWGTVPDGRGGTERPVYLRKLKAPWRVIGPPLHEQLRELRLKIRYSPRRAVAALREWWKPRCTDCGWPLKEHKPKVDPSGRIYFKRKWGYGIDHIRAADVGDGVLFEVAAVHCTGKVDSVLLTNSDAEALRDALDEYLAQDEAAAIRTPSKED